MEKRKAEMRVYPEELYQLAFAFRKTKLWKSLYESELFAVELPDNEIGYCCAKDFAGKSPALALYVGNRGLDSFRALHDLSSTETSPLRIYEAVLTRDCLQCSFESKEALSAETLHSVRAYASEHGLSFRGANAFPQFMRHRPARTAWPISQQEDIHRLCIALEAALEVSHQIKNRNKARLGFRARPVYNRSIPILTRSGEDFVWGLHPLPPKQPLQYPEQILKDELLMVRLKKEKKRRGTWVCDVALVLCPVVEPGDPVPIFPYTILMGVCETRAASSLKAVPNLEEGGEALLRMLGKRMLEKKIPREIQAADSRTYALLKNLADALNIKLVLQPKSSILDELENRFLAFAQAHIPDT